METNERIHRYHDIKQNKNIQVHVWLDEWNKGNNSLQYLSWPD